MPAHSPMLSNAFMTSPNPLIHSKSFSFSFTFPCRAWMLIPDDGLKCRAVAAATRALGFEMSGLRNRNWRLRFERSIVSRSIWQVSELAGERGSGAAGQQTEIVMENETPGWAGARWCYERIWRDLMEPVTT
jgi:hypothetical protein